MAVIVGLSFFFILLASLYLIGLAALILLSPEKAKTFLASMASSAKAHYLEVAVRLVAGTSFVIYAPSMLFASAFLLFGWVLIATTVCLVAMPWQWHQRFAAWSVPYATRNLTLFGWGSFCGGVFVLISIVFGRLR